MAKITRDDIDSKASTALATSGAPGLMPILPADTTKYLGGDLSWHVIAGGGDMTKAVYDPDLDSKIAEAQLTLSYPTHSNAADHSVNDVGTHGTAATGVHGAGTATIATTADVTTHASSTNAHIGGAGTVLSVAAGTVLITSHAGSMSVHGRTLTKLTANTTTATTALVSIPGLNFLCASTTYYHFKFVMTYASDAAATGLVFSLTYPSGTSSAIIQAIVANTGTAAASHAAITASGTKYVCPAAVPAANIQYTAIIEGQGYYSAAGSVQVQFANAAGTRVVTIYQGSVGMLYEFP